MTRSAAPPRVVLIVLFAGAFVMGCAEMLVVGLIQLIADDLLVSVPAAGALVTANALGLAVGGPLLALLTARLDRRPVLLGATAVFVLLNALPGLVADYPMVVVARVLIGAAQGLFIAAAISTATAIVPPDRAGRAMAVVISGFATASAVGLPLGTLLGQAVGWRGSFVAMVAVGLLVLATAFAVLPSVPAAARTRASGQARHAFARPVLGVLAVAFLMFTGIQSALTYLVPYLGEVTGLSGSVVSAFLLTYGIATAVGSSVGGRFADGDAATALVVGTAGVTVSLIALRVFGAHPVAAGIAVLGIGLCGMGIAPSLQHRVVGLAGPGGPLASSLPASVVNAGIAGGTVAGGLALDRAGASTAVLTGAAIAATAVVAAAISRKLTPANLVGANQTRAKDPSWTA